MLPLGTHLLSVSLPLLGSLAAQRGKCDTGLLRSLPLIERPALSNTNRTLVVLLTGDGGWAGADEKVSEGLRVRGAAVVGVNMRSLLSAKKSPEEVALEIGCVASTYLAKWKRDRLFLLGYSRGADIAPFVVNRWPDSLRTRLNLVAMVSLSTTANFKFHLIDLVSSRKRDDDVPVAPELEHLRGLKAICVYGSDEPDSGCRGVDSTLVRAFERPGGHRLTGGFDAVAEILLAGLKPAGPA